MISVVIAAFAAGVIHVLSGVDHLAAVAPLSVERRARTWVTGFRWGLGHAAGVVLVGALSFSFREVLPLEALSSWAERGVGVMLIGIGIWGLRHALTRHVHVHEHVHDGDRHAHIHVHVDATAHSHVAAETPAHAHTHAAFAVGTLHGLAGSSHFLVALPTLALPTAMQALSYLVAYGLGTISAMVLFSAAIAWFAHSVSATRADAYRSVVVGCSVVSLVVGGFWLAA